MIALAWEVRMFGDGLRRGGVRLAAWAIVIYGACSSFGGATPAPGAPLVRASLASIERTAREQAIASREPRHQPRRSPDGPMVEAGAHGRATVHERGARISVRGREATLRAASIGRRGGLAAVSLAAAAPAEIHGAEVRAARGAGVFEWWRSLPGGLEHGVNVTERPHGTGLVELSVRVDGALAPRVASNDAIDFVDASGARVATYAHLAVLDATGAPVPARMTARDGSIVFTIDDDGASYPLVVDPLLYVTEEAVLVGSMGVTGDWFGHSVAMSADGSRVIVGVSRDDTVAGFNAGSARVFVRTGSSWVEEATLVGFDSVPGDMFGRSVALSADGSLALVGVPNDDTIYGVNAGTARVYARTGSVWTEEATLLATDGQASDLFGQSVAFSADGTRAIVGVPYDDTPGGTDAGTARVFVRSGTTWTSEARLVAAQDSDFDTLGESVSLSADGSLAAVGVHYDSTAAGVSAGSVRIFARTGTTWSEQATLLASGAAAADNFGHAVSLSADGTRLLVGVYRGETAGGVDAGNARVFVRTGTTWSEEATLVATDGLANDWFGFSVSLSADGARALVGAPYDYTLTGGADAGSARVFVRTGTTWSEEATLVASDGAASDNFGLVVSLAGDGTRAVVGAFLDDTAAGGADVGSARVFTIAPLTGLGTACTGGVTCTSGHCVDGVCCDDACGDDARDDCRACTAALTGAADGTCAALSAAVAPTVACRPSAGLCDMPEFCEAGDVVCPAVDVFVAAATVCRPAAMDCDVAERCTGTSAACPNDAPAAPNTPCRPSIGACDVAEACDGSSYACPADARIPSGITCRDAAGPCDATESCDGSSAQCPADVLVSAGTTCRGATGVCDLVELCSGVGAACPADAFVVDGTACDDGLTCTQASACQLGACEASATLDCSDGDPCTTDGCVEPAGCTHAPVLACGLDAGADAGSDAATSDAGDTSPPPASTGCGCSVGPSRDADLRWLALSAMTGMAWTRARRRTRRGSF